MLLLLLRRSHDRRHGGRQGLRGRRLAHGHPVSLGELLLEVVGLLSGSPQSVLELFLGDPQRGHLVLVGRQLEVKDKRSAKDSNPDSRLLDNYAERLGRL